MSTDTVSSGPSNPVLSHTAARAIEALGGAERWLAAQRIEAVVSVSGLAWWLKMRRPVPSTRLLLRLHEPYARLDPIDRSGLVGVLDGEDSCLEDRDGHVVARRVHASSYFPGGRRALYWDSLDLAYFAGHAMWNYFTFPRLLLRPELDWKELGDGGLEAHFPPGLPTHSPVQRFYFDPGTGLLARHECTLEAVGPWAHVTQLVSNYRERDGVPYFGLRTVFFRRPDGSLRQWPKLITGRVLDWRLV